MKNPTLFSSEWIPALIALVIFGHLSPAISAQTPVPVFQGAWSGAAGPVGSVISEDPALLPLKAWSSVAGRLTITFLKPTLKTPNGTYSAVLSLFNGSATWAFNGKGAISGSNTISGNWTGVKGAPDCKVSLALSGTGPACLTGTALLTSGSGAVSTRYPLFALPVAWKAKTNPLPIDDVGTCTFFLLDPSSQVGTTTGAVTITSLGAVRLALTFTNGKKVSTTSTVLLPDQRLD